MGITYIKELYIYNTLVYKTPETFDSISESY